MYRLVESASISCELKTSVKNWINFGFSVAIFSWSSRPWFLRTSLAHSSLANRHFSHLPAVTFHELWSMTQAALSAYWQSKFTPSNQSTLYYCIHLIALYVNSSWSHSCSAASLGCIQQAIESYCHNHRVLIWLKSARILLVFCRVWV